MPNLKLTYFDFPGGRGEPARIAMFLGNIPFEDCRLSFAEFGEQRDSFPFRAVPVLEADGQRISQSNAINRYVGKLAKLYPEDAWQAALCDEAMDMVEDITHKIVGTFGLKGEEMKAARTALVEGPLTFYLRRGEALLKSRGGKYFADDRLTVADLKVFMWIRQLKSGNLEHVPADLADTVAPLLVEHFEAVKNHPQLKAYYNR